MGGPPPSSDDAIEVSARQSSLGISSAQQSESRCSSASSAEPADTSCTLLFLRVLPPCGWRRVRPLMEGDMTNCEDAARPWRTACELLVPRRSSWRRSPCCDCSSAQWIRRCIFRCREERRCPPRGGGPSSMGSGESEAEGECPQAGDEASSHPEQLLPQEDSLSNGCASRCAQRSHLS